jgi:hypothetical protein
MKRLIALVVVLALALAQGLEAFWKAVEVPGGVCSDGSPYRFYVSPGDPKKVVLDFQGGGACWDAATCGPQSQTYRKRVDAQELLLAQGIYNRMSVANPFFGWTHVFVPYCTGDLHVGRATVDYGGFKVHHQGARNAQAALEYVFRNHAQAERVFVTGCSAGAYGAIFWADKVLATYKHAQVAVCGDAGVGVATPDFPGYARWNPRFPELPGLSARPSVSEIYLALSRAYPKAVLAQYTTLLDGTQIFFIRPHEGREDPFRGHGPGVGRGGPEGRPHPGPGGELHLLPGPGEPALHPAQARALHPEGGGGELPGLAEGPGRGEGGP